MNGKINECLVNGKARIWIHDSSHALSTVTSYDTFILCTTKMSPMFHVNLSRSRDLLFNSPKLTRKRMHLKWPLISPVYNTFLLSVLYVLGTHTGNTLSLICACSIYVYESLCKYLYVWQFSTKLSSRMQGNGSTDQHSTSRIWGEGGLGHTGLSWLIFDLKNVGLLCALLYLQHTLSCALMISL